MKLVYNPGNTSIVYDDAGHMVAPGEWLHVEDKGTRVDRYLEEGVLVEVKVPKRMPESVDPDAVVALNTAINYNSAQPDPNSEELQEAVPEDQENEERRELRNTSAQSRRTGSRKPKNEEA